MFCDYAISHKTLFFDGEWVVTVMDVTRNPFTRL